MASQSCRSDADAWCAGPDASADVGDLVLSTKGVGERHGGARFSDAETHR